jgi:hypothetical protein
MTHLLVRMKVEDYAKFKPLFDQNSAVRKASGSKDMFSFEMQTVLT